jgi:capsid assembly protease
MHLVNSLDDKAMSSSLLLVNQDCFSDRLARKSHEIQSRLASKANVTSSSDGETWFDKLKSEQEGGTFERRGNVAVVKILGTLDYHYSFWSWLFDSSCYMGIMNAVTAAANDASINKIVLYVDSCGGGFHGCEECSDAILAARDSKEVVAVIDPEAASAGYWMASQANRIVCLRSGWLGSLGSQCGLTSYYRMYQELGIDKELIRAAISPDKNLGAQFEPISDKAREERQRWADYAGEVFVSHVMRGRGKTRQQILDNYGQGQMYFAPEAETRGMIDSIGNLQSELTQAVSSSAVQSNRVPVRSESNGIVTANEWRKLNDKLVR